MIGQFITNFVIQWHKIKWKKVMKLGEIHFPPLICLTKKQFMQFNLFFFATTMSRFAVCAQSTRVLIGRFLLFSCHSYETCYANLVYLVESLSTKIDDWKAIVQKMWARCFALSLIWLGNCFKTKGPLGFYCFHSPRSKM